MDEDKKKLWKKAIKWPLYSVAILPVLITGANSLKLLLSLSLLSDYGNYDDYNDHDDSNDDDNYGNYDGHETTRIVP